jgi:hypothetical protein
MGMGSADILGDDPLAKDLVDRARGLVGKLTAQPEGKL